MSDNVPCQDAYAVDQDDLKRVLAVSDGAGSAAMSHRASKFLTESLVKDFLLDESDLDLEKFREKVISCTEACREQLTLEAEATGAPGDAPDLSQFACTLLLAVATGHDLYTAHVGDGALVAIDLEAGEQILFSGPENGEYANETFFVTADDWQNHLRTETAQGKHDAIVLMSDGVTPMGLKKGREHYFEQFIDPLLRYAINQGSQAAQNALETMLSGEKIRSITGDDKTVVWAVRMEGKTANQH